MAYAVCLEYSQTQGQLKVSYKLRNTPKLTN